MQRHECPLSARSSLPRALIGRRQIDTSYDREFHIGEYVEIHRTGQPALVVGRLQLVDEMTSFLIRTADGVQQWMQEFELQTFQTAPERGSVAV